MGGVHAIHGSRLHAAEPCRRGRRDAIEQAASGESIPLTVLDLTGEDAPRAMTVPWSHVAVTSTCPAAVTASPGNSALWNLFRERAGDLPKDADSPQLHAAVS